MKIYKLGNATKMHVQYWYDRSTRCWWCAKYASEFNQVGNAEHAYTKREIKIIAKAMLGETKNEATI